MEILCIEGSAPGLIIATLAHQTQLRKMPIKLLRHPSGGWHVEQAPGRFGPRCHAAPTAILLEASECFETEAQAQ